MSEWSFPPASTSSSKYPNPPGYAPPSSSSRKAVSNSKSSNASSTNTVTVAGNKSLESLRQQRAWDMAIGPAKAVPMQGTGGIAKHLNVSDIDMTGFMLYMSGGGVQIFSLMIVFQLITGAVGGMAGVNQAFEPLEQQTASSDKQARQSFTQQKLVHILSQGLLLALGLYKCHTMGLLPTHDSDWLAFSKQRIPLEVSEISLGGWWQQ